MNKLFVIFCLLFAAPVGAITPIRLELAELFELSDVVLLVQIETGKLLRSEGKVGCGAEYQGRVLVNIKGHIEEGKLISFGPYFGESIGAERVLFLNRTSESHRTVTDQEGINYEKCKDVLPDYLVNFFGFGSIEVAQTAKFGFESAAVLKNQWLKAPDGIETKIREPSDDKIVSESGESWVLLKDLLGYLNSLKQAK